MLLCSADILIVTCLLSAPVKQIVILKYMPIVPRLFLFIPEKIRFSLLTGTAILLQPGENFILFGDTGQTALASNKFYNISKSAEYLI